MRSRGQRVEPAAFVLARLGVVAGALLVALAYLGWRAGTLGTGWALALAIPVFAVEIVAFVDLALLASIVRPRRRAPAARPRVRPSDVEVDVIITIGNDDAVELERSLIAANRIMGLGRLRVVDAEHRPSFQLLATRSGARYVVDPYARENPLAAAHRHSSSDTYLWLTAGQVAASETVVAASAHLSDDVAVCQVATSALNAEALAHLRRDHDDDHLVNYVIGPALHRWGVAPWSGSAALIRRAAVDPLVVDAGWLSSRRLTSRLHQRGWRTAFERRTLVGTVAPDRVDSFFAARRRAATDVWGLVLSSDGPVRSSTLPWRARIAQLATAARFTAGLRLALLTLALGVTLVTGVVPVDAAPLVFISFWLPSAGAAALARRLLTGGHRRLGEWVRLAWRSVDADLAGLIRALRGGRSVGRGGRRPRPLHIDDDGGGSSFAAFAQLRVAYGAVIVLDLTLLLRTLSVIDADIVPPFTAGWRIVVLGLAVATLIPVLNVLQMVARRSQRRRHDRRSAVLPAALNGIPGTTVDLSPEGVGLLVPTEPRIGTPATLDLHLPAADRSINKISAAATVASVRPAGEGRWRIGVELVDLTEPAHRDLVEFWTLGPTIALDRSSGTRTQPDERERPFVGAVTATAMVGGLVTVLLGPAAGEAFAASPHLVQTVCVVGADGSPVPDAAVERIVGEAIAPVAGTGPDGCAPVDQVPGTTGFVIGHRGQQRAVEATEYAGERVEVSLRRTSLRVVLGDGATPVPVNLRVHGDGWDLVAPAAVGEWEIETLLIEPAIEIELDGHRHVRTVLAGAEHTIVLARLVWADPTGGRIAVGPDVPAIDRGLGWEPLVTPELVVLPGRLTLRLPDGSVVRLDVPEGHEVILPAGEVRPRGDAVAPTSTPSSSEASTTAVEQPNPTTDPSGSASTTADTQPSPTAAPADASTTSNPAEAEPSSSSATTGSPESSATTTPATTSTAADPTSEITTTSAESTSEAGQ
ncbi:MAG: PilZ domain-containing protein [Actinomycetota bacterium]